MKIIQSLFKNARTVAAALQSRKERLTIWTAVAAIGVFSGQAHAANKITQAICDFKNYFFEGALVAAIGALAITAGLVWWLLDDDSKIKGKILGIIAVLFLITSIPELMTKLGWAAC